MRTFYIKEECKTTIKKEDHFETLHPLKYDNSQILIIVISYKDKKRAERCIKGKEKLDLNSEPDQVGEVLWLFSF